METPWRGRWFYQNGVTAASQALKIPLNIWWQRDTVCALPWGKVKPFHSWLLLGLPNVSPSVALVISLLICHHRWSLLFTCFLSLHYLLNDFPCDENRRQASEVTDDYRMRVMKSFPVRSFTSVSILWEDREVAE